MFVRSGMVGGGVGNSVGRGEDVGAGDDVGPILEGDDVGSSVAAAVGPEVGCGVWKMTISFTGDLVGASPKGDAVGGGMVGAGVGRFVVGLAVGQSPTGHGSSSIGPYRENGLQGNRS